MATLPLLTLLSLEEIKKLSSRSHFRLGQHMAEDAKITFTDSNEFRRVAEVAFKNHRIQRVDLLSTHKGLRYSCTCTQRKNDFCEHATAVALAMHNQ